MEKIAIIVDSTAYLSEELKKELDIKTVYLNLVIENNSYITSKHHYEAIRLFEKHFTSKPVTYSLEDIVQILTTYLENTKTQIRGKNE